MELFDIDSQTLNDLEIFERRKGEVCIFSLFNFTSTIGGKDRLLDFFKTPQNDLSVINKRKELIAYFQNSGTDLVFQKESMDFIEFYLKQKDKPDSISRYNTIKTVFSYLGGPTQKQYLRQRGVSQFLDLINSIREFCLELDIDNCPVLLKELSIAVNSLIEFPFLNKMFPLRHTELNRFALAKCDFIFRNLAVKEISVILDLVYHLDAYISVAKAAEKYKLNYPVFTTSRNQMLNIEGVFHLFIKEPVANDIRFGSEKNVCFITGANMSGKSTFLKSVAIAIYLAHLGFPVPANSMEISVFKGLMTTINLSDNLNQGYSHFYNEVMRVKEVARKVTDSKHMVVIFDELFRGTNVKDAYDGSLSIVSAFADIRDSFFMISTHIVEVAAALKNNGNIDFSYMNTTMENGVPQFSHQLKSGITEERMGMWIIENEGIIDILKKKVSRRSAGT